MYISYEKRSRFSKAFRMCARWVAMFVFALIIAAAAVSAFTSNNGGDSYDDDLYISVTVYRGQSIYDILPEQPHIEGYSFLHWSLTPDGEAFDFTYPMHEDMTFYAIWRTFDEHVYGEYQYFNDYDYYYSYHQYAGYIYEDENPIYYSDTVTIRFLWNRDSLVAEAPYKYQYSYIGSTPDYIPFIPFGGTPPFTLTFIFNDGVTPPQTMQTNNYGVLCCCDGWPNDPTHPDGLHFWIWSSTPSVSDDRWGIWPGFTFEDDTNLYAQWAHHVWFRWGCDSYGWYQEEYVLPGHSYASMEEYMKYQMSLPEPWFEQDYRFMGWYTRHSDGSFNERFHENTIVTEDIWVYPRFEPVSGIVVVFDPANGTPPSGFEVRTVGPNGTVGVANMPDDPTRPGRVFIGWGYCCCMNIFDGTREIEDWESPFTVTALWGVVFTFNCNYTTLPSGDDYYGFDPRIVIPFLSWQPHVRWPYVDPERNAYRFIGWYTKTVDGEFDQRICFWHPISRDTDVYARWEPAHTVIFNPNGGTTPYGHGARLVGVNGYVEDMPDHPHRGGHRFMAWTRTQDGLYDGSIYDWLIYFTGSVDVYTEDNPLTVYAQWGHQINFLCVHPDRLGSFWQPSPVEVHAGRSAVDTAALPWVGWINWPTPSSWDIPGPEWRFVGWFTNADVNNPGTQVTRYCNITSETYLFAHWVLRPQHTVTFDLSGGFLGTHPGSSPPGTQSLTRQAWDDESVRWSSVPVPQGGGLNSYVAWRYSAPEVLRSTGGIDNRTMHVESWWTLPGGEAGGGEWWAHPGHHSIGAFTGGRLPFSSANRPVTEDITVYADWVFRVTFHPNLGTAASIGTGFWTPGGPGFGGLGGTHYHVRHIPVGPGFTGGTLNDDGFLRTVSDIHEWCTTTQQVITTPIGTKVQMGLPRPGMMTRLNYTFAGWWNIPMTSIPIGEEPYGAFQFTGNELIDRDTTMYARWIFVPFDHVTVTFNVNGGSWWSGADLLGNRTTAPFQQGTQITIGRMPQFPVREGYIFMGWYRTQQTGMANVHQRVHSSTVINEDTYVFAHWERYLIVTFQPNGGTHPEGIPYRRVAYGRTFGEMGAIWSLGWQVSGTSVQPGTFWHGSMYAITGGFIEGSPSPQWFENGIETNFLFHHPWNYEPDASGLVLSQNVRITRNMTFYAQWVTRVVFNSNLETFITGGNCFSRHGYVPLGYTFRTANTHPHGSNQYIGGWFPYFGMFPTAGTWSALSNPMAAHIGFNEESDGSGTRFDIDTTVNGPMSVYGIWTTNVRFVENGAPEGSILPHNRERVVAIGAPLHTGVCPFTPYPYVTGMPDEPYWPGFRFSHWSNDPIDPRGFTFSADGSDEIHRPAAIYAIWRAVLLFDATEGTTRTVEDPIDSAVAEVTTFRGDPVVPASMPFNTVRSNWTFVEWNTARYGLRDGTGTEFDPSLPVIYSKRLYAQWRANVTFNLQGGHIDGNNSNVVRQVLEGDTVQNNGGIPTTVRPGYTFAGWLDNDGDPIPANFATILWAAGHTMVYADWEPIPFDFEFIKSTDVIYDDYPADPLPDAVFRLCRLIAAGDGNQIPDTWEQVGSLETSQDIPIYGLVRFEGLTLTGTYRLVEVEAPRGFVTPTGHWIIRWNQVDPMDHTTWILEITEVGDNPEFISRPIVGISPPQYRFYVGNIPVDEVEFHFRKTDEQLHALVAQGDNWDQVHSILLGGAIFELFRFYGDNPPASMLVYPGNIGDNPGQWERVGVPLTSSGNPADPAMMFSLTVTGIYHLVEVSAPQGFMTPHGQWRIWVDEDEDGGFAIIRVGCAMLPIILWNQEDTFYVPNLLDFELPVAGGSGRLRYHLAGIAMIFVAAGVWIVLYNRKRRTADC